MNNLEQTIEKSFLGKLVGRVALYSLVMFSGAGLICGCSDDQTSEEQDATAYSEIYDADSTNDYKGEADIQGYADLELAVPDSSTVSDASVQGDNLQGDSEDAQDTTEGIEDIVEPPFSCILDEETMTYVLNEGAVYVDPSQFVIIDGDTIKNIVTGITYRFSAIDAAELDQCGTGEFSIVHYGQLGQMFVEDAFYNAQNVLLVTSGKKDQYGRTLAYFIIDAGKGEELLQCLEVVNLLAWETVSFWGKGSFPPLADIVSKAAEEVGNPYFMEPWVFKTNGQPCTGENN